jgi:hypothetical protein
MRKLMLGSLMLISVIGAFAQTPAKDQYKKSKVLGVHFTTHDFATASDIKANGLSNVLTKSGWSSMSTKSAGLAVSYITGLSNNLDLMTRVGGSVLTYPVPDKKALVDKLLLEADVNLNIKLIPDNFLVVPYLSLGAGASSWGGYLSAYMPLGAGLQVNLSDESFIFLQSQYRAPITTNNGASHIFWGVGFAANLSK